MKIKELISYIEQIAPLSYQESYDNAGLITGNSETEITGVLITIDTIEEVIQEAIEKKANLIISHHPIIFSGLKKITGANYVERTVILAIQNNIAIYAAHTNMDNALHGVNFKIAQLLGLVKTKQLLLSSNTHRKLVTFVPENFSEQVRKSIFEAGAGQIGQYDNCSFNQEGKGTFRASEIANPYVGIKGENHIENEIRIETIFPKEKENKVIKALLESHPYEEVAYDIYNLENKFQGVGAGIVGYLEQEIEESEFLTEVKKIFKVKCIRHTKLLGKKIKKVAVCGGAGSFLLKHAIKENADIFISGDFKYHEFFDAENKIIIADVGHFESEQYTKELFYDIVIKKFNMFACFLSEINTNPIIYL